VLQIAPRGALNLRSYAKERYETPSETTFGNTEAASSSMPQVCFKIDDVSEAAVSPSPLLGAEGDEAIENVIPENM